MVVGSDELFNLYGVADTNFMVFMLLGWAYVAVFVVLYTAPLLYLAVCLVGAHKAAQGTVWTYPLTVNFRGGED